MFKQFPKIIHVKLILRNFGTNFNINTAFRRYKNYIVIVILQQIENALNFTTVKGRISFDLNHLNLNDLNFFCI
jgi:hypothetical protein